MTIPMVIDIYYNNPDWKIFFLSAVVTAFFGGLLVISNASNGAFTINIRQAFLLTALGWIVISIFASIPLYFSELGLSLTDSVFEAVSGITTTGATVVTGLDYAPPGILMWRSILQWLGGIGIIVMALSVLPFLKVGGMQLFRTESSQEEKTLPRAAQLANSIALIYVGLTVLCAIAYVAAGFDVFNAFAHAMTTIATGGFSTLDSSFTRHDTPWIEIVAIVFMILGALPFVLYLKALCGSPHSLVKDSQVRAFLTFVVLCITLMVMYLVIMKDLPLLQALRQAGFSVTSIITGTGYSNASFDSWGGFAIAFFLFLMVVGGCAGSTTCGIKIFRFQVLYSVTKAQIGQLTHTHGIFQPRYNGRPLPRGVPFSVMSFFFAYAACFALLAMALAFTGLDFITAISGAATSISNVGPGLGNQIGPDTTFQSLADSAKWILVAGMLLGRLEIFTLLVILLPGFWRR